MIKLVKQNIPVNNLLVNPTNPRFEPVKSQKQAIALMLKRAGQSVVKLAEDIAKHGLNPSKSLMVIEIEKGKFLPLEGNRRVTALKLLQNPEEAADRKFVERFERLKKEYGTQVPAMVECVVFPDKETAFKWVNLEHTGRNSGVGVLSWNSEQRQRFIAQYAGKTPSRPIQLFDFADQNEIDHKKVDPTTLDRIISTPHVRQCIGIKFPDGILDFEKPKRQVIKALKEVFLKMSEASFKVGDVYTVGQRKRWIDDLLGLTTGEAHKEPERESLKGIERDNSLDGEWIGRALYSVYPNNNRVKAMLGELKDLNPKQQPNVCASSLRVLLELAVYIFLRERGEIKIIMDQEKKRFLQENKKRRNPKLWDPTWAPGFKTTLEYMVTREIIEDPLERKTITTFMGKSEPFLVELNQFIHNPDYEPTPDKVIEIWNKFGKLLFRTILGLGKHEKSS